MSVDPGGTVVTGRRLDPDSRRQEILDAALRLWGERPYAAVSTTELAEAAGIARGLIHHYFGTKRGLYLEVVRRLTAIPDAAVDELPPGPPSLRARAAVDWFLDTVERHRGMWLAVGMVAGGGDAEVDAIVAEADEVAADRVLAALAPVAASDETVRARVRSFFGLVRSASREWLVRGTLDRAETRDLLVAVLLRVLDLSPTGREGAP